MIKKEKKFVISNKKLMKEWNFEKNKEIGIDPEKLTEGSGKKVWWICSEGHEWKDTINHRTTGRNCPVCAEKNRIITRQKNIIEKRGSLLEKNPKLAKEWHPTRNGELKPTNVTINSAKKVWWLCKKGHEWQAQINSRNSGVGCPVCSGHKIEKGYNDLTAVNPQLAREWHPTKNGFLTPNDVTAKCDKKVWWQCEKGHEWQARISNRSNGTNCPICSGKKVLVGYNDLATKNPWLAKEWNYKKNGDLKPSDVVVNSNKKVWWRCDKGHEWEATISHRTTGRNCPECNKETKTSFPEQAIFFYLKQKTKAYNRFKLDKSSEIDIYIPEYKIGIEYDGAFFHKGEKAEQREKRKNEKMKKAGISLIRVKEVNEKTKEPSEKIIYIKEKHNEEDLREMINNLFIYINKIAKNNLSVDVDIKRDRNKIYEQYIETEKKNSLLSINPRLAEEWHPSKNGKLLPENVSYSSNKKVWWLCDKGHEWQAQINSRNKGAGCPFCSGYKPIIGINDLATKFPDIAKEWHPIKNGKLKPTDVSCGSNKKVWWLCNKGHEWCTQVIHRVEGGNCPICSGKKVFVGYNDLATVNPMLAKQWHPIKNGDFRPTDVTQGSDKKVWWKCEKGHEWQATISSRSAGYGCPYCAGQRVLKGINDLESKNPKLAKEWHPTRNGELKPTDVSYGSNKKVWWQCEKGHEWQAVISSRSNGRGCPYCYKEKRKKR